MGLSASKLSPLLAGSALLWGCGGLEPEPEPPPTFVAGSSLVVQAFPSGSSFDEETAIELSASRPAAIYYTLDGEVPTRENALHYEGPITLTESTVVMFMAEDAEGIFSPPRREFYRRVEHLLQPTKLARTLRFSERSIFFAPQSEDGEVHEKIITIEAAGPGAVDIDAIWLGRNPMGMSFFENGVFELIGGEQVGRLEAGEIIELKIRYHTTYSLRSAAVVIDSNEERNGGQQHIEVWGRLMNW